MAIPTWTSGQVLTASDVNTWFVPISAIKTITESVTSSVALQNDDELFLPFAANAIYAVHGMLSTDGAAAGDFKMAFTGPASATLKIYVSGLGVTAAAGGDNTIFLFDTFGTSGSFGTIAASDFRPLFFSGRVSTAGTAGNLQLQWAQDTSSGTATRVVSGSYMYAVRIG